VNCQEVKTVIDGYVDGELGPIHNREIEQHLQGCAVCSKVYDGHQALQAAIRNSALHFKSPVALQPRIQSSLRQGREAGPTLAAMPWRWISVAASLAVVAILTWRFVPFFEGPAADNLLIQEVTADHVRSLMASHLVDIASSDRHAVKPWFTGKLDFAPSVVDLTDHGFPLIGGRLDYLDNRAVAAVIYKRREHMINVFIWPAAHTSSGESKPVTHQGYQHLHWRQAGMTYWVVSDLNSRELQDFVRLLQNQAPR
jgi:anti-sigma factor RsiW